MIHISDLMMLLMDYDGNDDDDDDESINFPTIIKKNR